jgi:hypothetical protein
MCLGSYQATQHRRLKQAISLILITRGLCFSVLFNVMSNEFVPEDFKERLKLAARTGRDNHTCLVSAKDAKQRRHLNETTTIVCNDDILCLICKFFQAFECDALVEMKANDL